MADLYSLVIRADTSEVDRAYRSFEKLRDGSAKLTPYLGRIPNEFARINKHAKQTGPHIQKNIAGFRRLRGAAGHLGMQMQDVAVQLQHGTDWMIVLGQQGSQVASIFGPTGAFVGAVIAAGSALATFFIPELMEGSEETETFLERIKGLDKSFQELTASQRAALRFELEEKQKETEASIERQKELIKEAETTLENYRMMLENPLVSRMQFGITEEEAEEARKNLVIYRAEIDTTIDAMADYRDEYENLIFGFETTEQRAERLEEEQEAKEKRFRERLKARLEEMREQAKAEKELQDIRRNLGGDAYAAQERYFDLMEKIDGLEISDEEKYHLREKAFEQHQERMSKIATKGAEDRKNAEQSSFESLIGIQKNTISSIGDMFGNMAEIAKSGGEKSFERYKDLASAQAGISAALAFLTVLDDPELPTMIKLPLAFSIAGLAAVQVAEIQNMEYGGARAMGGQVQGGKSYMVGENGPEMVTMGESGYVTPNHKLGGSSNITNVFQISAGVQGTVRSELISMLPAISDAATKSTLNQIRKGGEAARTVGRRR